MFTLEYSIHKASAVINEIERLKQSEFPYKSSKAALKILESKFKSHYRSLKRLKQSFPPPTESVVMNACSVFQTDIYLHLPILGFILRSTSTRNAFETYGPLLRLTRKILGDNSELILSSEWEFSPYIFSEVTLLPNFVMIGLPAQEAENPLLLPLAGHELGHFFWRSNHLLYDYHAEIENKIIFEIKNNYWSKYSSFYPQISKKILQSDLFARYTWMPVYEFAKRQIEEIFCDMMGLRIFAESFLSAFCYLLSPRLSGQRSLSYPNLKTRINYQKNGAKKYGVDVPFNFENEFEDYEEPTDPLLKLLVQIADITSNSFFLNLIEKAKQICEEKGIPERSKKKVSEIVNNFKNLVPVMYENTLSDILNASWTCFQDEKIWKEIPNVDTKNKTRILYDLALKSIEVIEIEERLK